MFTGLIVAMGRITRLEPREEGITRVWIDAGELAGQTATGDSVAVDGCCLTVVGREGTELAFDAIPETLRRTTLGRREARDPVNLELPLRANDRLGGHFVQGHVDAVTEVDGIERNGDDVILSFRMPAPLRGQVVEKGSIALDGVSLTVAGVADDAFSVALIPHTLEVTTLGRRQPGDYVNVEGDVLAKYVAALVAAR